MRSFATTVLDVTHSLQQPNQSSGVTGGRPEMIETIARAGVVNHIDGLFTKLILILPMPRVMVQTCFI